MTYELRYLKTSEEFELRGPDPLNVTASITVRLTDFELSSLIRGVEADCDDDAKGMVRNAMKSHTLSERTMALAKTKAHLRKLNRVDTAWLELRPKKRAPRKCADPERREYLRENFDEISLNCARHGWYEEYAMLVREAKGPTPKAEIDRAWRELLSKARADIILSGWQAYSTNTR